MFRLVLSGINSLVTEWVVMEERVPLVEGWMTLQRLHSPPADLIQRGGGRRFTNAKR